MHKNDSNKVLSHIDEAKNWLDEAKEEYSQSNCVRGELNLNLAQAEVKYAWELSRGQNVISSIQPTLRRRANHYFFPAAAAGLIVLGLTGGLFWLMHNNNKAESSVLTAKTDHLPIAQSGLKQETPVAKVTDKPVLNNSNVNLAVDSKPVQQPQKVAAVKAVNVVRVKSGPKIVKTEEIKKTVKPLPTASIHSQVVPETSVNQRQQINVADNAAKPVAPENPSIIEVNPVERNLVPNVSKMTMAALVIDEEALAKEASYSLKNGK